LAREESEELATEIGRLRDRLRAWIDPITGGLPSSQLNVAAVRFTPGARSAWHSHDGGQTLYVTEGQGLVQSRGSNVVEIGCCRMNGSR
jgi:quercetin dioxygenase-like cupin family protein